MTINESARTTSADATDVQVVVPRGELDLDNLLPLTLQLERAALSGPRVVLDASGITFGDSSFLRVLLSIGRQTDLRIAAPRPALERLIGIVGMDKVLKIHPTVAAAKAAPAGETGAGEAGVG
ncbi:STAS domain-containing protein [Actinacidiphila sp. ITFR-21]|uniref:STAS domain-containing protein n=1 Tax=Actinacidiphila sp. ITFR-21 TaxID=3075199 RepID=UPI00288C30EC|nr:STAS domain-containing protein [Streptomyces sp. ITFR-21]WNI14346.1 STAS domain-containing protein [Streptomyces sp. ITFR-21]